MLARKRFLAMWLPCRSVEAPGPPHRFATAHTLGAMPRGPILIAVALLAGACGGGTARPAHTADDTGQGGSMHLASDAFEHDGTIPAANTCDGGDASPQLTISGIPGGTAALALVMDDPDAPRGVWDHWVVYDIPAPDGALDIPGGTGPEGTPGSNSWGRTGYGGPCPPSGVHRYFFTVYALDEATGLAPGASKEDLLRSIEGHVLAEATLMGRYGR
jgi:Raf kinase inhibitor-like YbhB/YbcL family protein